MADWTETYRPTTLSEVRGNDKARDKLKEWAETWDDHREAVVVHGSPGVGKTSAAHALANDMGWETVELNASDQRTADVIEKAAGRAAMNTTLDGSASGGTKSTRQLVVMDEADNIHGNYDRGGAGAITSLVKESEQPIVLIANDYYDMSRGLRNATQEIEFRDVSARSIVPVLRNVCRSEGIEFESDALQRIAETNSGDLRSAVKDLQAAAEGRDAIRLEHVVTSDRDRSTDLFSFLDAVMKEESAEASISTAYSVDETPDDLTKWIAENVPKVYDGAELARAYDHLANADRWLGRVMASQNYSYWRYATDNLAGGVAAARDGTKGGWTRFNRPQFWPSKNETRDELVQRIAEREGVSMGTARREILPFLQTMTHHCKPRELTVLMAAVYDLDEAGVSYVTGSGETTNKVQSIVEDAEELREAEMEDHAGSAFEGARRTPEEEMEADGDSESEESSDLLEDPDEGDDDSDEEEPDDSQTSFSDFG
jgi:replication factor C large subunit